MIFSSFFGFLVGGGGRGRAAHSPEEWGVCEQKLFALLHLKLSPHPQRARVGARTHLCPMPWKSYHLRVLLQMHFISLQEHLRAGGALHHLCLASFTSISFSCSWLSTRLRHKCRSFCAVLQAQISCSTCNAKPQESCLESAANAPVWWASGRKERWRRVEHHVE